MTDSGAAWKNDFTTLYWLVHFINY